MKKEKEIKIEMRIAMLIAWRMHMGYGMGVHARGVCAWGMCVRYVHWVCAVPIVLMVCAVPMRYACSNGVHIRGGTHKGVCAGGT